MTVPNGSILIDSATGSNTAASGLGPATAISGTGASLNATSTVDLSADAPDLSGVTAGDLLWVDTSSGRQYSIIASVNDGTDSVTCDDAFAVTEGSRNWGIGGKRASLGGSAVLWTTDAKGGWTIELADGHTETIAGPLTATVTGDLTDGPIVLQGESGATVKPILIFSNDGDGLVLVNYHQVKRIEFRNSNVSKTASTAISCTQQYNLIQDITVTHSTDNFYRGLSPFRGNSINICEIANAVDYGIYVEAGLVRISHCNINNCGSSGIRFNDSAGFPGRIVGCDIWDNGAEGIDILDGGGLSSVVTHLLMQNNRIHGNTNNGINVANAQRAADFLTILENIITDNGGYGIDCNGLTANFLNSVGFYADRNVFYNNTSGKYLPTDLPSENEIALSADPFMDAANGDFNINDTAGGGAALRAITFDIPG